VGGIGHIQHRLARGHLLGSQAGMDDCRAEQADPTVPMDVVVPVKKWGLWELA